MKGFVKRGAVQVSHYLRQDIDSASPTGRRTFPILGAAAQFEREMLRARVLARIAQERKDDFRKISRPVWHTLPLNHEAYQTATPRTHFGGGFRIEACWTISQLRPVFFNTTR